MEASQLKQGQSVTFFFEENQPAHAVIAKVDILNTEDNSRPRVNLSILMPGLAKWTARNSVLMYGGADEETKKGKWAITDEWSQH